MSYRIGDTFHGTARITDIRSGGMGVVYICEGTFGGVEGTFAVKTYTEVEQQIQGSVPGQLLNSARGSLQRRFAEEALINLDLPFHPNIVATYSVNQSYGAPYLVLQYVDGSSLRELIDRGPLEFDTAVDYAGQLLAGLKYAFDERQLLHRDIKPENILLTRDGVLKIADFGLARIFVDEIASQAEAASQKNVRASLADILGTLPYMSPEQAFSPDRITVQSDFYSFGVVLFEMLTGRRPFLVNTFDQMLDVVARKIPPRLSTLRQDVSDKLCAFVARCLSKQPQERFASYNEILDEWQSLAGPARPRQPVRLKETEALFRKATGLINLGMGQEALTLLQDSPHFPTEGDLLFAAGTAQGNLHRHEEAVATFSRALELETSFRKQSLFNQGNSLLALGRHAEAATCYQAAVDHDPGYAMAWSGLAQARHDLGDHAAALEHADWAIALDARNPNFWTPKAMAHFQLGQADAAAQALARIRELGGTDPTLLRNLAVIHLQMDQMHEAAAVMEARLQHLPALTMEHIQDTLGIVVKCADEKTFTRILTRLVKAVPESAFWDGLNMPMLIPIRVRALLAAGHTDAAETLIRKHGMETPGGVEMLVNQAVVRHQRGDAGAALELLRRASVEDPTHAAPYYQLGCIHLELGRVEEALSAFDESIERGGGPNGSYASRARTLQQLGRLEESLHTCDLALAATPEDTSILKSKGRILQALQRHAEAIRCFEDTLKLDPQNTTLLDALWESHFNLQNHAAALECSERILEITPKDAVAWYHKGVVLFQLREHAESMQCYLKAVTLRDDLYVAHTSIGIHHLLNEDFGQAILHFDRALQISPDFVLAISNRVIAHLRQCIRAAVEENPELNEQELIANAELELRSKGMPLSLDLTRMHVHHLVEEKDGVTTTHPSATTGGAPSVSSSQHPRLRERAFQLAEAGVNEEAIMLLRQLVHSLPSDFECWHALATCLDAQGQQEEALACFNQALQAMPPNVWSPETFNGKGEVLRKLGRHADAVPLYDQVLKIVPDHEFALNNRGICLKELGRMDDARASFQLALTSHPDSWRALGNLAQLEAINGRPEAALECCHRLRGLPQHLMIHVLLTTVYHQLERDEEMHAELAKVRALEPDHPIVRALASHPWGITSKNSRREGEPHLHCRTFVPPEPGKPRLEHLAQQCAEPLNIKLPPHTTLPDVEGRTLISADLNSFRLLETTFTLHLLRIGQGTSEAESHITDLRPDGVVHLVTSGKGEAGMTIMMGRMIAIIEIDGPYQMWSSSTLKRLGEIEFNGDTFLHCSVNPVLMLDRWLDEGSVVKWGFACVAYQNDTLTLSDVIHVCFYWLDDLCYPLFHLADARAVTAIQRYGHELVGDETKLQQITPTAMEEKLGKDTMSKLFDHHVINYYLAGTTATEAIAKARNATVEGS